MRDAVKLLHERRADTRAAVGCEHGDTPNLAGKREVDAARADSFCVGDREHVHALRVALVHLEVGGDALLIHEYGEADATDRGMIRGEIG